MGYGIRSYIEALAILTGIKGEKTMSKKADSIREALIKGAGRHRLALVTIKRAKHDHPETWRAAAIHQLAAICGIDLVTSRMLISEMCLDKLHT